ncbi:hypothetical protein EDD16DRAFT_1718087 [Pisolithus croceorrhizus]|nr:hypothetical protein EV401DRAFT_2082243 [Pisolithus croceorrhizus]KAI6099299.1 hypothetical protein EDD16DRAFT_1718087 [Pisolithus croceorrhizus]
MSSARGKRGRKTKQKYPESSGFNPSGNSAATQLGVTEEQLLASYEIECANAGYPIYETTDPAGSTLLTIAGHRPPYQHFYCPQVPTRLALGPVESISGSLHPLQSALATSSSLQAFHSSLPPALDYSPSVLTTRHARTGPTSRMAPYNLQSQHPERHLQPGEAALNEAFIIPWRPVIQQVGQTSHSVARDTSNVRLPPACSMLATSVLSTDTMNEISTNARSNLKRLLLSQNLLPDANNLSTMIRGALHEAALGHEPEAAISEWLQNNVQSEIKKLKDIAANIRNDFRAIARILALPLYHLLSPIHAHGQEVLLRQQKILALLLDFMLFKHEDGSTIRTPFSHSALVQLVLNVLWGERQYWRYLIPGEKDLTAIMVFAGTALQLVLNEYISGTFATLEFNTRANRSAYNELNHHLASLQGEDLACYSALTENIFA